MPPKKWHSKRISVLLDAAAIAYPWGMPTGCCALLGVTLRTERLKETNARAQQVCHYTGAPFSLFSGLLERYQNFILAMVARVRRFSRWVFNFCRGRGRRLRALSSRTCP